MKKMLIVMCVIGLMVPSAWAYPGPNSIGVYTDDQATGPVSPCAAAPALQVTPLYLLISGPTGSQVSAWEGQVELQSTASFFGNWEIVGDGLNVGSGIDYIVGHGMAPLQPNPVGNILLMTMDLMPFSDDAPIEVYIRRLPGSLSFSDGPGYAPSVGVLIPLMTSTGGPTIPVFVANPTGGDCTITSDEVRSWGSIKTLYK